MSLIHLIAAGLRYHFRIHAAVALGVLTATAVLTGALLIGDSMRGSLQHLTLDRLGRIDSIVVADRFFRASLASELSRQTDFARAGFREAVPALVLPSTSIEVQGGNGGRASGVLTLGVESDFWKLGTVAAHAFLLQPDEIVLNQPLADELHVQLGDTVILRLPAADQVPADSPLGRKENLSRSLPELKIVAILPASGLGRFSLRPNQALPRNAYVAARALQGVLEQPGKVNAVFVSRDQSISTTSESATLDQCFQPKLADYGLSIRRITHAAEGSTSYDYIQLTSDRMLLEPAVVNAARAAFLDRHPQIVFTYLANRIEKISADGDKPAANAATGPISYSTICAVDSVAGLGPAKDQRGHAFTDLGEHEMVLNDWAADDQQCVIGDSIKVTYFQPETTHGDEKTTSATFKLRGVTPLFAKPGTPADKDQQPIPTTANDPHLTPEVAGVTDAESIAKWDAPFPVDYSLVRPQDDKYWDTYRTTPKAFISLAAGEKLWGSRWGQATAVRINVDKVETSEALERRLLAQMRTNKVTLGLAFQPIKRRDLAASSGTTPFDALFLGLSFFLVASALLLIVLLFRLGIEQRANEIGVLLGLGFTRRKVLRVFLAEGIAVAAAGAALGVLAGVGYAWLMLVGLKTWWLGAIATPFLDLYVTPRSLLIGFFASIVASCLAMVFGLRSIRNVSIRRLLAGQANADAGLQVQAAGGWANVVAFMALAGAIGMAFLGSRLTADGQAVAFLGSGAAVLFAVLLIVRNQLQRGGDWVSLLGPLSLARLAFRSAARNPSRSLLTLALVGSASFLLVALSAFRLSPSSSGSGGFEWVGESDQPVLVDLSDPEQRQELLADDAPLLGDGTVLSLRLQPGDDASCRNLYQPAQPRVLGVPSSMVDYFNEADRTRFAWSASSAKSAEEKANPWQLLDALHGVPSTDHAAPVPVILDQNTAMYSLKLYGGAGEVFRITFPGDRTIYFKVVGLLANSVLQGSLLIGEADFKRLFPQVNGYRYFLVHAPHGDDTQIAAALENHLSDQGLDLKRSNDVLTDLMAVQNTYLSTFQSLGALGLLLGTVGLAAVQMRSILERRGELGLLRAAGFRRSRLTHSVMLENIVLLAGGLFIGVAAALVAILPHMLLGGARPPLLDLAAMLGLILFVGCSMGALVTRNTLRSPLVTALRGE